MPKGSLNMFPLNGKVKAYKLTLTMESKKLGADLQQNIFLKESGNQTTGISPKNDFIETEIESLTSTIASFWLGVVGISMEKMVIQADGA